MHEFEKLLVFSKPKRVSNNTILFIYNQNRLIIVFVLIQIYKILREIAREFLQTHRYNSQRATKTLLKQWIVK